MNKKLVGLLDKIEQFGIENDQQYASKEQRMRNINRTTGEFLSFLVKTSKAKTILEIGTSNGYSTIWLADALPQGGCVTTLEYLSTKAELAAENFKESGLGDQIHLIVGDAGDFLTDAAESSFDFIFLDSDRTEYIEWWSHIKRIISPGGVIVVDNAISHEEELSEFITLVKKTEGCESLLLPFDSGVFVIRFSGLLKNQREDYHCSNKT